MHAHRQAIATPTARRAHVRVGQHHTAANAEHEDASGREFAWTQTDFSRVQALIYQRAGINLHVAVLQHHRP